MSAFCVFQKANARHLMFVIIPKICFENEAPSAGACMRDCDSLWCCLLVGEVNNIKPLLAHDVMPLMMSAG